MISKLHMHENITKNMTLKIDDDINEKQVN